MTPERKTEIQGSILRAMSAFGEDQSASYRSMSFVGLKETNRAFSIQEYVEVLQSMEGVILDTRSHEVWIPISYFKK